MLHGRTKSKDHSGSSYYNQDQFRLRLQTRHFNLPFVNSNGVTYLNMLS
jgi:hypothetical protein